jgi:hypothetical protein
LPPQPIGAEDQNVFGLEWHRGGWNIWLEILNHSDRSRKNVLLRMGFGFFGTYGSALDQARYQRMIAGELPTFPIPDEEQSAVTDMGEV